MDKVEREQFAELYEAQFSRVYNYISYRINNHMDTEDLVSQVFAKVIERYDSFDPGRAALSTWIIRIAHNTVVDYYRAKSKTACAPLADVEGYLTTGETPDMLVIKSEQNLLLMEALGTLKARERELIALKYGARLGNKEIAQVMGLSESNVGVTLLRTIRKLRAHFDKEESVCRNIALRPGKIG